MPASNATADLQIVNVPIDDLHPDPANPRKIGDQELDALTRSLREFDFLQPVIARQDGTVVGGHQRLVAARRLGIRVVPVVYVDLTDEQAKLLNLALNKISGDWDEQLLASLLADLNAVPDVDLALSGFGEDEVAKLLKTLEKRGGVGRSSTSTSNPQSRRPSGNHGPRPAMFGSSATTTFSAATRPRRKM